ncbi:Glycosyltransferase [Methanosarcina siciliae HI350]|uniref:Glycosyltransferase n=1 Tax=Methanosarcina siciliae HI350 TaxID=1434119 RepID=A0A0E3PGG4_9EURY|nr:glycosyltransferase family 4 protein [Methanosarcina siciliae]AKB33065.1 Glycosyltransferase [Methanosarcina siciliae HI350]
MVKVAIIHNIVTPYRLELFERLSKHKYIDELNVFYCLERYNDRNWSLKYDAEYKYKILPGYTFMFPMIKLPCSINPSIFNEIRNNNYDAVIICGFTDLTTQLAYFSCKINRIPIILWSELSGVYLFKYHRFYNPVIAFFLKNSDALMVPSTQSKEYHIKMGASSNKIFVSPNTNDEQRYIDKIKKCKENSSLIYGELSVSTTKNIIFVGRFIKRKCVDHLIRAFIEIKAEMDDLGLILIGDGPEKENLQALCKDLEVKDVYFTGFVSEEEKIKYYSISNLFVLPSLWDIHPLVLPEAMACSLPIISTTGVASVRDIIFDGENGYIVNTEDVSQLSSAIKKVFCSDDIELMGKRSLQILNEKCSLDVAVEGFINSVRLVRRER